MNGENMCYSCVDMSSEISGQPEAIYIGNTLMIKLQHKSNLFEPVPLKKIDTCFVREFTTGAVCRPGDVHPSRNT